MSGKMSNASQSNYSFGSAAFSNNLKARVKTVREKQAEYAVHVPKPKQHVPAKQDISHLQKVPGTYPLPDQTPSRFSSNNPKMSRAMSRQSLNIKEQSKEKTRFNEYRLLEDKRELLVTEVDRIKREMGF